MCKIAIGGLVVQKFCNHYAMLVQDEVLNPSSAVLLACKMCHEEKHGGLSWSEVASVLRDLACRALKPSEKNPVEQIIAACIGLRYLGLF